MIKNKDNLSALSDRACARRRQILIKIIDETLKELESKKLFQRIQKKLRKISECNGGLYLISIGKAGKTMARAAIPLLKKKPNAVFIADKGHPLPTKEGLNITKKIMRRMRNLSENDTVMVLISGGGSAMLVSPAPGISLTDKVKITLALLKSGATIQEINVVRKHISLIKGGLLAKHLYPAKIICFVISDVVGNDLSTITSGPLSPDPSTFADALKIINKYKITAPKNIMTYLCKGKNNIELETPKSGSKYFENVQINILADHSYVAKTAYTKAKKLGIKTKIIANNITGEARDTAKKIVASAKKNTLIIATGETTVTCRGSGCGGRNQELALSALNYLKPNQTLVSIGTDGIDGICPKKICGAIADSEILAKAKKNKLDPIKFLQNNDSYGFFTRVNGLIKTGATGTNLGDLIIILTE